MSNTNHIPAEFLNTNPNSKALFRPGGDAQYVSFLLGGLINHIEDGQVPADTDFETYMHRLARSEATQLAFSPSLQSKFLSASDRLIHREIDRINREYARAAKKAAKAAKSDKVYADVFGHVAKVGRWTYPVRAVQVYDGKTLISETFERNTARDRSGEWVAVDEALLIDA